MQLPRATRCAGVKGATRLLDGVSRHASSFARSVRSGALADALGPDRRSRRGSRWPYSLWLAQPYAKVTGPAGNRL